MIEIRFQGRGGQGVVVASELLARASFEEGAYPQSFSIYGGERRGAPVAAFVRISDKKIHLKCDIERPDHLVLFDSSFCDDRTLVDQVKPGGVLMINADDNFPFDPPSDCKVGTIEALQISQQHGLGAIVNTAILGAYVGLTQIVRLESILKVIVETVPAAVDENLNAAKEAYERVVVL